MVGWLGVLSLPAVAAPASQPAASRPVASRPAASHKAASHKAASQPASAPAGHATTTATTTATTQAVTTRRAAPPLALGGWQGGGNLSSSPEGGLAYTMLAYVLVILVVGALAVLVTRKVLPRLGIAVPSGRNIAVQETAHLGTKSTVYLLRVGSRRILVGSCRESLVMLGDVTEAFDESDKQPDTSDGT